MDLEQVRRYQPWFTSDTHYGHHNILRHAERPFSSVEEMGEAMISRWNEVIGPETTVYFLGDFTFYNDLDLAREILSRLPGRIHLILGNHDSDKVVGLDRWESVSQYKTVNFHGQTIRLFHYPLYSWHGKWRQAWALCGHSHGLTRPALPNRWEGGQLLDVGVDVHGFRPISFLQVKEIMDWKWERMLEAGMVGKEGLRQLQASVRAGSPPQTSGALPTAYCLYGDE